MLFTIFALQKDHRSHNSTNSPPPFLSSVTIQHLLSYNGCFTFENEYTIAIPPAKLFKAFVLDTDNIIPKVVPHAIKSSQITEGDGGPGSIRKLSFAEGMGYNYVTQKMEEVDKNSFSYNYSLIGGDALLDSIEKVSFENQFVASPDGGSICKRVSKFYTKGDADVNVTEEHTKETKKTEALFKAVEVYLLENPYQYA